jgi:hypothetical protein
LTRVIPSLITIAISCIRCRWQRISNELQSLCSTRGWG